jgi:hypothetical protein
MPPARLWPCAQVQDATGATIKVAVLFVNQTNSTFVSTPITTGATETLKTNNSSISIYLMPIGIYYIANGYLDAP